VMGCAGILLFGDGTAEVKRMFVAEPARGTGTAGTLLAALETAARQEGVHTMLLETGPLHHAAQRLYARAGYTVRGPFAAYEESPGSIFMEKSLA
jgi:GNAT superfamily N-acetyltransferase